MGKCDLTIWNLKLRTTFWWGPDCVIFPFSLLFNSAGFFLHKFNFCQSNCCYGYFIIFVFWLWLLFLFFSFLKGNQIYNFMFRCFYTQICLVCRTSKMYRRIFFFFLLLVYLKGYFKVLQSCNGLLEPRLFLLVQRVSNMIFEGNPLFHDLESKSMTLSTYHIC